MGGDEIRPRDAIAVEENAIEAAACPEGPVADLGRPEAAERIERAVKRVLGAGYRTADIYTGGMKRVSTQEMGRAVAESLA